MKKTTPVWVSLTFLWLSSLCSAGSPTPLPPLHLTIKDLTPKFLQFYRDATAVNAGPDLRWQLWKKDYDFAAVPPTPDGEQLARQLLDKAWPKYPAALQTIRGGATSLTPDPQATVRAVAELLRPTTPVDITLLVYVGDFEGNAFTAAQGGKRITVALPIEGDQATRALRMTHELTHAVHISMGSFSGGWIRTVGTTILTEGLAMRVTQKLLPGHPESYYVEARPGWFEESTERRNSILQDMRPVLSSISPKTSCVSPWAKAPAASNAKPTTRAGSSSATGSVTE